jgi:hypothetical protein
MGAAAGEATGEQEVKKWWGRSASSPPGGESNEKNVSSAIFVTCVEMTYQRRRGRGDAARAGACGPDVT